MIDFWKSQGSEDEVNEFGLWAFGEAYKELATGSEFIDAWNKLHSQQLLLTDEGQIVSDCIKMVTLYKLQR